MYRGPERTSAYRLIVQEYRDGVGARHCGAVGRGVGPVVVVRDVGGRLGVGALHAKRHRVSPLGNAVAMRIVCGHRDTHVAARHGGGGNDDLGLGRVGRSGFHRAVERTSGNR